MNKILVCITIQENSRRLIQKGYEVAQDVDGSLHILHIRKGESVFEVPESAELLEELFSFGSGLGGEVHFLCSDDVLNTINEFVKENKFTHIVIGEAPNDTTLSATISTPLMNTLKSVEVCVLPRT